MTEYGLDRTYLVSKSQYRSASRFRKFSAGLTFLGSVKWHRLDFQGPTPHTCPRNGSVRIKTLRRGLINHSCINSYYNAIGCNFSPCQSSSDSNRRQGGCNFHFYIPVPYILHFTDLCPIFLKYLFSWMVSSCDGEIPSVNLINLPGIEHAPPNHLWLARRCSTMEPSTCIDSHNFWPQKLPSSALRTIWGWTQSGHLRKTPQNCW